METPQQFLSKPNLSVVSALSCYDRVILKGYVPFTNEAARNSLVDYGLRIKRQDFIPLAERTAEALVEPGKAAACEAHVEYRDL